MQVVRRIVQPWATLRRQDGPPDPLAVIDDPTRSRRFPCVESVEQSTERRAGGAAGGLVDRARRARTKGERGLTLDEGAPWTMSVRRSPLGRRTHPENPAWRSSDQQLHRAVDGSLVSEKGNSRTQRSNNHARPARAT